MKISIVDDVAEERRSLRDCLLRWSQKSGFVPDITEFQNGWDFINSCLTCIPAIVFMDIYRLSES